MNDFTRWVSAVESVTGRKRGRHPVFNANAFYPHGLELELCKLTRDEFARFMDECTDAALVGILDDLNELSGVPDGLPEDVDSKLGAIAGRAENKVSQDFVNWSEMTVGKPYYPPEARRGLVKEWKENFQILCKSAKADMKKDISRTVQTAKSEGWNKERLKREVKARLGGKYKARAENIARTELGKLNSAARLSQYKEVGITYYRWLTTIDGRERDTHRAMNGVICSVSDKDVYYEETPDGLVEHERTDAMYHGNPGEDFQCRCSMVAWDPEIDGLYEVKEIPKEVKEKIEELEGELFDRKTLLKLYEKEAARGAHFSGVKISAIESEIGETEREIAALRKGDKEELARISKERIARAAAERHSNRDEASIRQCFRRRRFPETMFHLGEFRSYLTYELSNGIGDEIINSYGLKSKLAAAIDFYNGAPLSGTVMNALQCSIGLLNPYYEIKGMGAAMGMNAPFEKLPNFGSMGAFQKRFGALTTKVGPNFGKALNEPDLTKAKGIVAKLKTEADDAYDDWQNARKKFMSEYGDFLSHLRAGTYTAAMDEAVEKANKESYFFKWRRTAFLNKFNEAKRRLDEEEAKRARIAALAAGQAKFKFATPQVQTMLTQMEAGRSTWCPPTLKKIDEAVNDYRKAFPSKLSKSDEKRLENFMAKLFRDNDLGMNIQIADLEKVFNDGFFRSQFETMSSCGFIGAKSEMFKPDYPRLIASHRMFNLGGTARSQLKPSEYEKYGSLLDHDILREISEGGRTAHYGEIMVRLEKKYVEAFTTWTASDSLGSSDDLPKGEKSYKPSLRHGCGPFFQPSLVTDPKSASYDSMEHLFHGGNSAANGVNNFEFNETDYYIELQYHCPLPCEVVESLAIGVDLDDSYYGYERGVLQKWKDKYGIPVYYVKRDPVSWGRILKQL